MLQLRVRYSKLPASNYYVKNIISRTNEKICTRIIKESSNDSQDVARGSLFDHGHCLLEVVEEATIRGERMIVCEVIEDGGDGTSSGQRRMYSVSEAMKYISEYQ